MAIRSTGELIKQKRWALKILYELIGIDTVIPPGKNYGKFANYSAKILKSLSMHVSVVRVPRSRVEKFYPEYADYPRYVVLAKLGSGRPVLHFNGHYDVVPAGHGWTHEVFPSKPPRSSTSSDWVYGRGASDMKGGIAAIMLAVRLLVEAKREFSGTIEVSLTPDEEIGGHSGLEYVVAQGLSRPDFAVIAEPSGLDRILIGHKGSLQILVEVYGENAHGSMTWRGKNAFPAMVELASSLEKEYTASVIRATKKSNHRYSASGAERPTIMLGGILRGGNQQNLVPAYSAFSIDRRIIPEENPVKVKEQLLHHIVSFAKKNSRMKKHRIECKILNQVSPAVLAPNSRLLKTIQEIVFSLEGATPRPEVAVGTMDAGYFLRRGIDTVAYGPGQLYQAHVADEHISMGDVFTAARIYERLARTLLRC